MSAYMMPAKTTAIIAEYLARAAGEVGHTGTVQGAKTIGITGYPNTPVKAVSDVCLELYSPDQLFVSPRVAQFSLIDSLYVSLAIRQKEYVVGNIRKMEEVLGNFRIN